MVDLQEISEQINEILKPISKKHHITLGVYNQLGKLVAVVGKNANHVHAKMGENTPINYVFRTEKNLLIYGVGKHPFCNKCSLVTKCTLDIEMLTRIMVGEKCVGILTLVTWNSQVAKNIWAQQTLFIEIMHHLTLEIKFCLQLQIIHRKNLRFESFLKSTLELNHQGILLVDENECVAMVNRAAGLFIDKMGNSLHNRHLDEIIPQEVVNVVRKRRAFRNLEIAGQWWEGHPVIKNNSYQGMLITINKSNKINNNSKLPAPRFELEDILGTSKVIEMAKEKVRRIARTDLTVLIRGESGTGKELFAGAIHSESDRKGRPFVAVNCAALPENLMESELFGYEEGAFTGARKGGKPGKFEIANRGTLLLDEIGDMPMFLQAKLLRVIQYKEVERVGGTRPIPVDVRLIAATNRPLEEMIESGKFRADLYYRLNVIPLDIPPLRERIEDIQILLEFFTKRIAYKKRMGPFRWSAEALNVIYAYHWPGNIRELEHTVEHAISMTETELIQISSLPQRIIKFYSQNSIQIPHNNEEKLSKVPMEVNGSKTSISDSDIVAIRKALARYGTTTKGKERAAQSLGISRATLYRRLKLLRANNWHFEDA